MKKRQTWLASKMTILLAVFITLMSIASVAIVYFWSYYYFGKIFEDRIIDEYTYEKNEERGVYNEWILGVTAHSIDIVEAIHGQLTAEHILDQSVEQMKESEVYREKIDGKYLLYKIDLDYENGEKVYKYSIVKDIYREILPKMLVWFLAITVFIFILSVLLTRLITNKLYHNIHKLKQYIMQTDTRNWDTELVLETEDADIQDLASSFSAMKYNLKQKDLAQQSMLQYISHELKTPVMIISSYAESAKDGIYPKGTIEETLDTITNQAIRIENRVEDLLFIAKSNAQQLESGQDIQLVQLDELIEQVVTNLNVHGSGLTIDLQLAKQLTVIGYQHELEILIENMLDNQMKYANKLLSIRCVKEDGKAVLYFHNDGQVIDSSIKDQLFTPFTKGEAGAHGLGLSIVKEIAEKHQGSIDLVKLSSGVTFKIILRNCI
ncbi:HAMP domain-containing sensor histidine kinase [Sporosarcina ureae]|uniref:sensor histidine kinase n=1 Tax=Sporosarcina ureae TaxID=1571 RepID=UPI0026F033E8|nr:HAMP domain-containing sensor histidine kinase [Sporosarcina ureae]